MADVMHDVERSYAQTVCIDDAKAKMEKSFPVLGSPQRSMTLASSKKTAGLNTFGLSDTSGFHLCDHYSHLLELATEHGFENMKWTSGFTLLHWAAKKNNRALLEYLLAEKIHGDLHAIDDFGKKPIDYACKKKRDSVYDYVAEKMKLTLAPDTEKEREYQQYLALGKKNLSHLKETKKKVTVDIESIIESAEIADGAAPPNKKAEQLLSTYEVEQQIPAEYKRGLKTVQGGWDKFEGKWPKNQTLLHWAARNGKEEICKYCVLFLKADVHEECGNGKSAIDHARLKKHRKLAKSLIKKFKN